MRGSEGRTCKVEEGRSRGREGRKEGSESERRDRETERDIDIHTNRQTD